jgi:hypothetical protein
MNGKNSEGDILVQGPFFKWLDNFWYHYKWHTAAVLFITFVLTVCITQCARKEKHDVVVMSAGPYLYSGEELLTVKDELNKVLPGDFNGDGKENVGLVTYQVMTDEQLLAYKDLVGSVDTSYFTAQSSNCNSYILTGECAILLIDKSLFEQLRDADRLRNLNEVFPTMPSSAIDEYGIDFTKTSIFENSKQLAKLPEGTVLCLMRPYVVGNISQSEIYSQIVTMFVGMARS